MCVYEYCCLYIWDTCLCVQQLNNRLFEELAMDVYDEVDRRENDAGESHVLPPFLFYPLHIANVCLCFGFSSVWKNYMLKEIEQRHWHEWRETEKTAVNRR